MHDNLGQKNHGIRKTQHGILIIQLHHPCGFYLELSRSLKSYLAVKKSPHKPCSARQGIQMGLFHSNCTVRFPLLGTCNLLVRFQLHFPVSVTRNLQHGSYFGFKICYIVPVLISIVVVRPPTIDVEEKRRKMKNPPSSSQPPSPTQPHIHRNLTNQI